MRNVILLAVLLLAGCSDPPKMRTEAEIRAISQQVATENNNPAIINGMNAADRISELERVNEMQERRLEVLGAAVDRATANHKRLLDILSEYEKDGRFN